MIFVQYLNGMIYQKEYIIGGLSRLINEEYVYQEPVEWTKRRNSIRKNQVPIENLQNLIEDGANEREIQKIL